MWQPQRQGRRLGRFPIPILCWTLALLMSGFAAPPWLAAQQRPDPAAGDGPWEISADRIAYDQQADTYLAEGNVTIARDQSTLTADRVRLDQKSRLAWAEGRVRLLQGADTLTGDALQLHLDDETGTITNGHLFLSANHFHITGKQIRKTGADTYHITDASATTCDGPDPDWRLTGKEVRVTIEGYGHVKHAALWAKKMPLIYSPYMFFPVKSRRQTGLLTPEAGHSDRLGVRYLQPLYWAISDSTDATFFVDHLTERGTRLGAEFRYTASDTAKGTLMFDGFNDRRIDDGEGDNTKRWGYGDDRYLRTNQDRYWFRAKLDQPLPGELMARVDLDVVSDQDYLKTFESGYGGFQKTRQYFRETFGRDLDDYNDPVRVNQLNINRIWTGYTFNTDLRWYDDIIQRRQSDTDTTLQQLPQVTLDGTKKRIAGSPFYFDLLSSYTYFYRETGTRGHRADLYPRAYYPMRLFDSIFVEPSAGFRQTAWHVDHYADNEPDDRKNHYRPLYDLKLDASTDFFRVYRIDSAGHDRVKHGLKPRIVYEYIPDEGQTDLPLFDDTDRIAPLNRITYSLTNTLIARAPRLPGADGAVRGPEFSYTPFMRLKLEESFDIDLYKQNHPRPFSPILAELEITPGRYGRVLADALWSPYDGEFYAYNAGVLLQNLRGDQLRADYRFTRDTDTTRSLQTVDAVAIWQVNHRWQLRGKYERNLETRKRIETGVGISYQAQCWRIDLDYRDEPGNQSIGFMIHLAGLGGIGN
ncbi:MAG: LPS-assembly protein LptD [Desulfatitalea sp.]|nr:LPS-assembly protein LptD [Desulfatitalea sp.]